MMARWPVIKCWLLMMASSDLVLTDDASSDLVLTVNDGQ